MREGEKIWQCGQYSRELLYTKEELGYHVHLLGQAGLLKVADTTHRKSPSPEAIPGRMTWEGHEYLDAIRSDTVWRNTKDALIKSGAGMTIELVKTFALAKSKERLGL